MSKYKQTAFRLSSKALKILDALRDDEELNNRTSTLEFFLRKLAKDKGLEID